MKAEIYIQSERLVYLQEELGDQIIVLKWTEYLYRAFFRKLNKTYKQLLLLSTYQGLLKEHFDIINSFIVHSN